MVLRESITADRLITDPAFNQRHTFNSKPYSLDLKFNLDRLALGTKAFNIDGSNKSVKLLCPREGIQ